MPCLCSNPPRFDDNTNDFVGLKKPQKTVQLYLEHPFPQIHIKIYMESESTCSDGGKGEGKDGTMYKGRKGMDGWERERRDGGSIVGVSKGGGRE